MTSIKTRFGVGGANLAPGGHGRPTLATTLRDIADDLNNQAADAQIVDEEIVAVASHLGLLRYEAEAVGYVYATAGSVTGKMLRIPSSETLATGEYHLGSDNRTLTFFAADAVTALLVGYKKRATQPAEMTGAAETYVLVDGQTLLVEVDGGSEQTATFNTADFSNIAAATADEVAVVIDTDLTDASAFDDGGSPTIRSDTRGLGSSLKVTGGTANAVLGFTANTLVKADQILTQKG